VSKLSLEERTELLVAAVALHERHDERAVLELLTPVSREDLLEEPELGLVLAQAHVDRGDLREARALLEALTEPCRRRGYDQLYRRRMSLEGGVYVRSGDLQRGETRFSEVLHRAVDAGDLQLVALTTQNLAVIAAYRGEWEECIAATLRAVTAMETVGGDFAVAVMHRNLGTMYREAGYLSESDSHFDMAVQLFRGTSAFVLLQLAELESERALTINLWGDRRRAEATARHALATMEPMMASGHPPRRSVGEALRVLGMILVGAGRFEEAGEHLRRALEISRSEGIPLTEGETCEALSVLAREAGDLPEAERWAAEALRIYDSLGAATRIARLREGSAYVLGR
jgi:tetratricopeptide (TPR) repeat protein